MAMNDRRLRLIQQISNLQSQIMSGQQQKSALAEAQTRRQQEEAARQYTLGQIQKTRPADTSMEELSKLPTSMLKTEVLPRYEGEQNIRRGFDLMQADPNRDAILEKAGISEEDFLRSKSISPTAQATRLQQLQQASQALAQEKADIVEKQEDISEAKNKALNKLVSEYSDEEIASVSSGDITELDEFGINQVFGKLEAKERQEKRKQRVVGLIREDRISNQNANDYLNAVSLIEGIFDNEISDRRARKYNSRIKNIRNKLNKGLTLSVRDLETLEEAYKLDLSKNAFDQYVDAIDNYNANKWIEKEAKKEQTQTKQAEYKVGDRAEQDGVVYEYDGKEWIEVN